MIAAPARTGPVRQRVVDPEGLPDHRHVRARHEVQAGSPVGTRQPQVGERRDGHRRPPVGPHRQRAVPLDGGPAVLHPTVGGQHLATPHARERDGADRRDLVGEQRGERHPVRPLRDGDVEDVCDRGEEVHGRCERVNRTRRSPRPRDQQRDVAHRLVHGDAGLAPDVTLAEVMAVVRAEDDGGVVPPAGPVEHVDDAAEPVVDHRQLRAVVRSEMPGRALVEDALLDRADGVRRPDEPGPVPRLAVPRGPRLGRVEGLVGVELVDEEEEAVVVRRVVLEPAAPRRPSCGAPGSPTPRGTRCGTRRTGTAWRRARPVGPAPRATTGRLASATGRSRGPVRSPTRRSPCGSSRRRPRTGAGGRTAASLSRLDAGGGGPASPPTPRSIPRAATGSRARRRGCRGGPGCTGATRRSAGRTAPRASRSGRVAVCRTRCLRTARRGGG